MSTRSKNSGRIPVVALFGPTGVGKTGLILKLFSGIAEVVCADSMQVYRYMNIGAAKPGPETLKAVPHHLMDIRNPDEQYTAGDFVRDAHASLEDIGKRAKLPLVSGGTAFYFKYLLCGPSSAPPADPSIRKLVKEELEEKGASALYEELSALDPKACASIHPSDVYRITRALEVIRLTGRPLSAFPKNSLKDGGFVFLSIGLNRERADLHARIEKRVEDMFRLGLTEEVRGLLKRGYGFECPGMRGIGYREYVVLRDRPCSSLADVRSEIIAHTRQYAKRQLSFFKALPGVVWLHPEDPGLKTIIGDFFKSFSGS